MLISNPRWGTSLSGQVRLVEPDGAHNPGREVREDPERQAESGGVRLARTVARAGQRGSDNARTHGIPWVLRWPFGLDLLTEKPRFSPGFFFGCGGWI